MANIDTYLQAILEAVYGEEVRDSIHDAIEAMNNEIEEWTELQDGSVTTRKLADGAVTKVKLSTDVNTILDDMKTGFDGVVYPSPAAMVQGEDQKLQDQIDVKADNIYGGPTSSSYLDVVNGSTWDTSTGTTSAMNIRARSNPILILPNMQSISIASGYLFCVVANNDGYGYPQTFIHDWNTSFDIATCIYKYIYIVIKRSDNGVITGDDLTSVLSIAKYTTVVPYITTNDLATKLNGRYTDDSEKSTKYVTGVHGAFNMTAGQVDTTMPLFANRIATNPALVDKSYIELSVPTGYSFAVYENENGAGSPFTLVTDGWTKSFEFSSMTKPYYAITARKDDNSDISSIDATTFFTVSYGVSFAKYLSESEIKDLINTSGQWQGQKILWLGTSIPEQGYPQIVGNMIGATVTNNAVGSSLMRIGQTTYDNSPLGDDLGITGMSHLNVLRSLSMTQEERLRLFICWKTDDRKAYLMSQGYSAAEVANVVGYSEMLTGSFPEEDTDPGSGQIPVQKPIDVFAGDGQTYLSMRQYSYSCCWDDSTNIESGLSYTHKVTGSVTGKLKSYVVTNDWIFMDHFRNDAIDATSELYLTIPTDKQNRHYAIGAFNYLLQQIYYINPNAKVLIIGHYDNDDLRSQLGYVWQAQEKAANLWAIPIYKLWEESGIRAIVQFSTTGYWDSSHVWHDTGYNGSNSVMNNLENLNENPRQVNGVWYHDLSLRQKWMWDDIHPLTMDCKNHIANLIASWLKTKSIDIVER